LRPHRSLRPAGAKRLTRRKPWPHSTRIWQETDTTGTSRGKAIHTFGTETAVLEKKGDAWSIVHVH
jgi:hypothetical protein